MGSRKQKQTTTNNFQHIAQPANANYDTAKRYMEGIDLSKPVKDAYANKLTQINEGNYNIFGRNTSNALKNILREEDKFKAMTQLGTDLSDANMREAQLKSGAYMNLGDATKSQLVNMGGTTVSKSSPSALDVTGQVANLIGVG